MNPPPTPPAEPTKPASSRRSSPRPKLVAFAVTAPGLEAITSAELEALGVKGPRLAKGGVSFLASTRQLYLANLWLRTSTRVVVRIERFHAASFSELEAGLRKVRWGQWIDPTTPVRFRVASHGSQLYHTGAIEQRVLHVVGQPESTIEREPQRGDEVDDDIHIHTDTAAGAAAGAGADERSTGQDRYGPRDAPHSVDEIAQLIMVRINHDQVTISIDSSGAPLSQRGYRRQVAKAPLRENLAAALLLAAGWDGSTPLIDPMCGSGTIAIEAALIARRIPPGHRREFAFARWPGFEPGTWSSVVGEARHTMLAESPQPIVAADRDAGAIAAVTGNAERAGVTDDLELRAAAISDLAAPANQQAPMTAVEPGWLITNPPYGNRIASGDERDLYARLGQATRSALPGWQVGLLVADTKLAGHTGFDLHERLRFSTGGLPVRYLTTSPNR